MKRPVPIVLLSLAYAVLGMLLLMAVTAAVVVSIEGRLPGVMGSVFIMSDNGRVTPAFLGLRVLVFALSILNFAVVGGLWKLRNWSRVAAVIETAILLGLELVWFAFVIQEREWRTQNTITEFPIVILTGMILVYLLLPSTRRTFEAIS